MENEKKRKRAAFELTSRGLWLWGTALLAVGLIGASITGGTLGGLGLNVKELDAAMESSPGIMRTVTALVVTGAISSCAAPIFAFLLAEGALKTKNMKLYLLRTLAVAAIAEIPYNLALGGRWIDTSSRNPAFGAAITLLVLFFFSLYPKSVFVKVIASLAGVMWMLMLRIEDGAQLLILTLIFTFLRGKPLAMELAAATVSFACCLLSLFYFASPLGVIVTHFYNGERGGVDKRVRYAVYPALLVVLAIVKLLAPK